MSFLRIFGKKRKETKKVVKIETVEQWMKQGRPIQRLETIKVENGAITVKEIFVANPRIFSIEFGPNTVRRNQKAYEKAGDIMEPAYVEFLLE